MVRIFENLTWRDMYISISAWGTHYSLHRKCNYTVNSIIYKMIKQFLFFVESRLLLTNCHQKIQTARPASRIYDHMNLSRPFFEQTLLSQLGFRFSWNSITGFWIFRILWPWNPIVSLQMRNCLSLTWSIHFMSLCKPNSYPHVHKSPPLI